jgi:enoyl-CoA hydratase/carnithine racemase
MAELVLHITVGHHALITLNRAESRNPTSIAMLDAMDAALDAVMAEPDLRVVTLAGEGRSFCSGLDLAEVRAGRPTVERLLARLGEVMRRVRRLPAVTITRVQGAAIGGGFGFMAATDFAITHPEARIGYPPIDLGLSPALMAPWLVRKIGPSAARSMLLAGGTISGAEAHERGLATHLVAQESIDSTGDELATTLAAGAPYAMREMKNFLNELDDSLSDAMLDRAAAVSADVIASDDTQARLAERLD